jgi:PIN domain nuclease of toxin-antitoxin system
MAAKTPEKLSRRVTQVLESPSEIRVVSVVTSTEIAIKWSVGKLEFPATAVRQTLNDLVVQILPFTEDHAFRLFDLPLLHKDPIDRQWIAQALSESVPVVTNDAPFRLTRTLKLSGNSTLLTVSICPVGGAGLGYPPVPRSLQDELDRA